MEETIDLMVGRIRETTKEITETLAGTIDIRIATEIIIAIAATHQDRIENHSITDTESPSTECLIIGVTGTVQEYRVQSVQTQRTRPDEQNTLQ